MAGRRLSLLLVALLAPALAWGDAPLTSPLPRPRPPAAAAQTPPPRPAGAMTISEAVEAALSPAGAAAPAEPPAAALTPPPRPPGAMTISEAAEAALSPSAETPPTELTPPPRPPGAMTIAEAAEAQATEARQEAEAARQAAESVAATRIAAQRVVAERIAETEAEAPEPISRMAVASSAFPRHRSESVMQRYAALAAERARARAQPAPAPTPTPAAQPARAGGPSGRGLCGVPGLAGRELPPITSSNPGCGVAEPVSVTSVDGIPLSMAASLECGTATAFERWVRTEMLPAVGNSGGGVAQIRVIGHYSCRTRNSRPSARISEHARGRAIDVAGFRLANGTEVSVQGDYRRGRYSRMLHRMYQAACGIFHTTLSPDSDRYHQDHFHFDMAQYRNGGTYCH